MKIVNVMPDHVHCLFLLNRSIPLADVIRHAKGGSTFYINKHQLLKEKFAWQTGYSAFSVTHSAVGIIEHYIRNQKKIHAKRRNRVIKPHRKTYGMAMKKKR